MTNEEEEIISNIISDIKCIQKIHMELISEIKQIENQRLIKNAERIINKGV